MAGVSDDLLLLAVSDAHAEPEGHEEPKDLWAGTGKEGIIRCNLMIQR